MNEAEPFRGPFYIHASKRRNSNIDFECEQMIPNRDETFLDFGALIATATLTEVKAYRTLSEFAADQPKHLVLLDAGDFGAGPRYGFVLSDIKRLEKPIACKGMLNFFTPKPEATNSTIGGTAAAEPTPEAVGKEGL